MQDLDQPPNIRVSKLELGRDARRGIASCEDRDCFGKALFSPCSAETQGAVLHHARIETGLVKLCLAPAPSSYLLRPFSVQ